VSDKQAVLLIHGIGEQRPMETLRAFVHAVWTTDASIHHRYSPPTVWSKPDTVSGSYELRRLTTGQNREGIRTDFFEFYWAHLMSGTTFSHVIAWARLLLLRWPWKVPIRVFVVWLLMIVTIIGTIAFFIVNAMRPEGEQLVRLPAWLSSVGGVVLSVLLGYVVKQVIGDAARYLDVAPSNIERRQAIRAKGVEILKKLHESDYRRIIVVGHSLGSVIGYDILTYAWAEFNTKHNSPDVPQEKSLLNLEALIADPSTPVDQYQKVQREYFDELRGNGNPWRVNDFITLGSPLVHADILLAKDEKALKGKQADREFPRCPPVTEKDRISYSIDYEKAGARKGSIWVPHHAALFGPTRWTNLYFPVRFVIWGDMVGGALAPLFGAGIRDVAVRTAARLGFLSHTLYWAVPKRGRRPSLALEQVRKAMDLADTHTAAEVVP
jgi:hypothetical protein